ncbi:uncharacterized protein AAHN32_011677 [Aegotheles albertisi]
MWGGSCAVWKRRFSCYGPWESVESCVVRTSASVYRRLQESPGGMSTRAPPAPPSLTPGTPSASGRLLKSESEDSGVEMPSAEHSPSTPPGSERSFALDGFPRGAQDPDPPQAPRSRSGSRRLVQAAQRSRRQRAPGRCPRQLGGVGAEPARDPRDAEDPQGAVCAEEGVSGGARPPGSPPAPVPGQGLRYLEHVCQMLERLARLQQDNRQLRQQAADTRHSRPDTAVRAGGMRGVMVVVLGGVSQLTACLSHPQPSRGTPGQDTAVRGGERFRPRSCSDSLAPALDSEPCRRTWGHSASSPSLLEPSESGASTAPDKDGRSHWGRVKVLLTRLARRSLRGGRCR